MMKTILLLTPDPQHPSLEEKENEEEELKQRQLPPASDWDNTSTSAIDYDY